MLRGIAADPITFRGTEEEVLSVISPMQALALRVVKNKILTEAFEVQIVVFWSPSFRV